MNFEVNYNASDFACVEQQTRDILRVIDTITPVLGLMRDYYKAGEQLKESAVEIERANGEIQAYSNVLASFELAEDVKLSIEAEIKKVREYGEKCSSLQSKLFETMDDLQDGVDEYYEYIHCFDWLYVNILVDVLHRIPTQNKTKLLATILLFTNNSIDEKERDEIFNYLWEEKEIVKDVAIRDAILLLQNNTDAFIQYISERNFE